MILVTQGHENSISIEVFLKSFLLLSPPEQKNILFFVFKGSLEKTLNLLNIAKTVRESNHLVFGDFSPCYFTTTIFFRSFRKKH